MSYAEGGRWFMSPDLGLRSRSLGLGGGFVRGLLTVLSQELILDLDTCLSLRLSLACLAAVLSLMVFITLLVGEPIGAFL